MLSPPQRTPFRLGGGQCEIQAYAILYLARELTKQIARFIHYWRVTTPHFAYAWGLGSRGLFFSESRAMHKNARAFKAHAFIAHGVGYVKKKARAFISHAMHIKARDMKKTARGGRIALFLEKARAVIVHRCP